MGLKNLPYLAREISWLLKNEQPNTSFLDTAARLVYPLIFRNTFLVHKSIFNSLLSTPHTAVCKKRQEEPRRYEEPWQEEPQRQEQPRQEEPRQEQLWRPGAAAEGAVAAAEAASHRRTTDMANGAYLMMPVDEVEVTANEKTKLRTEHYELLLRQHPLLVLTLVFVTRTFVAFLQGHQHMLVLERHLPHREKEILQLSFESTAAGQAETASTVDEEAETTSAVDKDAERAVCRGRARGGHGSRGGGGCC